MVINVILLILLKGVIREINCLKPDQKVPV